jgi:hypothetical protein
MPLSRYENRFIQSFNPIIGSSGGLDFFMFTFLRPRLPVKQGIQATLHTAKAYVATGPRETHPFRDILRAESAAPRLVWLTFKSIGYATDGDAQTFLKSDMKQGVSLPFCQPISSTRSASPKRSIVRPEMWYPRIGFYSSGDGGFPATTNNSQTSCLFMISH